MVKLLASALMGAVLGLLIGWFFFRPETNPIVVYFIAPTLAALIACAADGAGRTWLISFAAAATCSFVLFLVFPDPRTPLLGRVEYWAVIGLPVFSIVPFLVANGIAYFVKRVLARQQAG